MTHHQAAAHHLTAVHHHHQHHHHQAAHQVHHRQAHHHQVEATLLQFQDLSDAEDSTANHSNEDLVAKLTAAEDSTTKQIAVEDSTSAIDLTSATNVTLTARIAVEEEASVSLTLTKSGAKTEMVF